MTHPHPPGFLAVPPTGQGDPVLVLHAWWGLNDTMKAVCTRLAEAGFVAFAPDLYHGKVAETIPDAEALAKALDANYEQAKAEIREAATFLESVPATRPRPGGDRLLAGRILCAGSLVDRPRGHPRVVIFYGTGSGDFSGSQAAYLGHFAENDEYEPQVDVDALEEALEQQDAR